MTLSIRPAVPTDAAAICAIYNHFVLTTTVSFEVQAVSTDEMAQRIVEVTRIFPWLVCEEAGSVKGYAYAVKWRTREAYRHAVESSVYVDQNCQGRGIGAQLYRILLSDLRARAVHTVIGGIAQPNPGSVALHEKMGFSKVAHFAEVGKKFDRWIDVAYWQLIL